MSEREYRYRRRVVELEQNIQNRHSDWRERQHWLLYSFWQSDEGRTRRERAKVEKDTGEPHKDSIPLTT